MKRILTGILISAMVVMGISGCGSRHMEETKDSASSENILITETGEILEKPEVETQPFENEITKENDQSENAKPTPTPEPEPTPNINFDIPVQEQVITEEDQIESKGNSLQLVFLGDSIFDNNRDGTGIPYLTAIQCNADVFNLAIGGTSATLEEGESAEWDKWTSRGLCGMANALNKRIDISIFEGTRAKEILDNSEIDFSQTDYFIVEYGTNDFFRAVRQSGEAEFDLRTYAGALRYGVSNLKELAPDATVILCSPCYAQFFNNGFMVGDGNVTNPGNGTLFDYAGTCNYIAKETQSEFFNAYQDLGIDSYTAEEYLEDGVHLTEAGRQLYADALAHMILSIEETKNN